MGCSLKTSFKHRELKINDARALRLSTVRRISWRMSVGRAVSSICNVKLEEVESKIAHWRIDGVSGEVLVVLAPTRA